MPDLGGDMGNVGVNAVTQVSLKLMEALLKLLKALYKLWREKTNPEYKLKKEEMKLRKEEIKEAKLAKELEGSAGYIEHEKLVKAKVPLSATGIKCTKEDFRRLSEACARNGIIISAVEDVRSRELGGKRMFVVECRTSDLDKFADLCDAMNDARRIEALLKEKKSVLSKGKNMTEEDKLYVQQLDEEIQAIRDGRCNELNQEQADAAIDRAVNGSTEHGVSLSEALDRWTGGTIDKDTTCYIVDAKDPDRYIVATATQDQYKGNDYIKTTYDVYNKDGKVFSTHDGRFDGRPKDYWQNQKAAIQQNGGLSDTVIKFYSREEMEAYREAYAEQKEEEIDVLQQGNPDRSYDGICQQLHIKLSENEAYYRNGKAYDRNTEKPIRLKNGMTTVEQARVAEILICAKQIENYQRMEALQIDISVEEANLLSATEGTPEYKKAKVRLERLESEYKKAEQKEAELIDERNEINFVQAQEQIFAEPITYKDQQYYVRWEDYSKISNLETLDRIASQDVESFRYHDLRGEEAQRAVREELEMAKAGAVERVQEGEGGKPDSRRTERVSETTKKPGIRQSMANYMRQIREDRKQKESKNPEKSKGKEKTPKAPSHSDKDFDLF